MRPSLAALGAVLAAAVALPASAASAAPAAEFQATNLDGGRFSIPAGLRAERTILLLGFRHQDQAVLDGWRAGMRLTDADANWLEIPVIPVTSSLIQPMIRSAMRKRFATEALRAHVVILFATPASTAAALGVSADEPAAVVMDRTGRVVEREAGAYDATKAQGLLTALRAR